MKRRIVVISVALLLFCGVSVLSVVHVLLHSSFARRSEMVVTSPSPAMAPKTLPFRRSGIRRITVQNTPQAPSSALVPLQTVESPFSVQLSHAHVTVIGGQGAPVVQSSGSSAQAQQPLNISPLTVGSSFYAMAATRPLAAPGASAAPALAQETTAPPTRRDAPGPPDIIDLPIDEQLPVGEPWILLAMAVALCSARAIRQKVRKN